MNLVSVGRVGLPVSNQKKYRVSSFPSPFFNPKGESRSKLSVDGKSDLNDFFINEYFLFHICK